MGRHCMLCGDVHSLEVGHVNGFEEDTLHQNLIITCRSCNARCAVNFKKHGYGRRVRQYNPSASGGASSLREWVKSVLSLRGEEDMSLHEAIAMIHATPASDRSRFAREIWQR